MNLYILRHGKAAERSRKWHPDSTRPLTRDGEKKMLAAAAGMKTLDVSFDLILTSPYIRAFRTAEIVAGVFESKKLFETKNLVPDAEPESVIEEIKQNFAALQEIALVGHEPFLSRLVSFLLSGRDNLSINLRKGALCKISVEKLEAGPCGCLEWMMTSKQLSRLRR